MKPDALLIDYDQTLYSAALPTLNRVDERISTFIQKLLGLSYKEADQLRQKAYREFGTTLEGLRAWHGVEPDDFFDDVQNVEEEFMPPPNPELKQWLERVSIPIHIFTNARADWALRGIEHMKLGSAEKKILDVFDIKFVNYAGKPHESAYIHVAKHVGETLCISSPKLVLADDHLPNLQMAKKCGWNTVWITHKNPDPQTDIDAIHRELWEWQPDWLL